MLLASLRLVVRRDGACTLPSFDLRCATGFFFVVDARSRDGDLVDFPIFLLFDGGCLFKY